MQLLQCICKEQEIWSEKKGIEKSRRPPHEVICRKYCCNKEGVKMLGDKRQGLTITHHIDSKVHCPTEMQIRLRSLPDRRF